MFLEKYFLKMDLKLIVRRYVYDENEKVRIFTTHYVCMYVCLFWGRGGIKKFPNLKKFQLHFFHRSEFRFSECEQNFLKRIKLSLALQFVIIYYLLLRSNFLHFYDSNVWNAPFNISKRLFAGEVILLNEYEWLICCLHYYSLV